MTAAEATQAAPTADAALFALVADLEKARAAYKILGAEWDAKHAAFPPETNWRWRPAFGHFKAAYADGMRQYESYGRGPGVADDEREAFEALWAHLSAFYETKSAEAKRLRDKAGMDELEARMQTATDKCCDIISQICHTKPETLAGAIVLLREAVVADDPDADDDTMARASALATLDRLAGGGVS